MRSNFPLKRYLLVVILLSMAALFLALRPVVEKIPKVRALSDFPTNFAEWQGKDFVIPAEVREVLGPGDFLSRVYVRNSNTPYIDLFVAYFPTQRAGDTIHSPKNCLPGSGWSPIESRRVHVRAPDGKSIEVNRYVIAKGLDRQLVLYWYQAHSRVVASEYWAKFYLVADAIRLNRTDGALVRLITPMRTGEVADEAQKRVLEFSKLVLPSLDNFIAR